MQPAHLPEFPPRPLPRAGARKGGGGRQAASVDLELEDAIASKISFNIGTLYFYAQVRERVIICSNSRQSYTVTCDRVQDGIQHRHAVLVGADDSLPCAWCCYMIAA